MLPRPLTIPPVGAVAAASPAAAIGDGRQAAFQRALQSLVGQSVTGEVLARFNDGSFMVNVAEHAVRMQLPADASVGSRLPLTVLSAEPRATFELAQPSSSVVLYGEAHTPAGTGDLYRPGAPGQPPAPAQPSSTQPSGTPPPGSPAPANPASSLPPATGSAPNLTGANAATATSLSAGAQASAATATTTPPAAAAAQLASTHPAAATLAASALAGAGMAVRQRQAQAQQGSDSHPPGAADADPYLSDTTAQTGQHSTASAVSGQSTQASRTQHAGASLLGKALLTPAEQLPALDAATSQPELSSAARLLGSLASLPSAASALPLLGKTALFSQGAPEPSQLAQTLQNTIEESGLFYESHVAAWSRGERSLEQLQREPQMQQARAQSGPQGDLAALPDRSAAQQINQQLLSHEQGRVLWQGEAWPGQPMQWEIRRQQDQQDQQHAPGGQRGEQEATPVWRSNLRLRFAALGELTASITMVGPHVHLQLQADDQASGLTLRAQAGVLEQAMAAAGIPLSSCQINQGEPHDG